MEAKTKTGENINQMTTKYSIIETDYLENNANTFEYCIHCRT